ncbi:acyltransferase [Nesterenkonia aerolata]|uniref:Acyltransferase n=1 Tax=Nesterenkonia aerolata TaxID=3074079 RepID=A0ABU2DQL5_9MICC|nr:acyltransferase [Nesterenkonia sp. LY-0111]MDR8018792.1 acyltransferase [Nesterenkonia sp. LY-0111]
MTARPADPTARSRDLSVDVARVLCLLAVVAIHTAMIGIGGSAGESGHSPAVGEGNAQRLEVTNPLTELWFFAVGTWLGQVMPLFFLLGGFGAYMAMRSARSATDLLDELPTDDFARHLRRRTLRLGPPAAIFYTVMAGLTLLMVLTGLPAQMLDPALEGAGDPLWFLAAFLICQGFVRRQYRLVTTASAVRRWAVLGVMVAGIICVDTLRMIWAGQQSSAGDGLVVIGTAGTWADMLGLLNMWLLWPVMQLLGMMLAHGCWDRVRWWGWALTAVGSFSVTAALATWTWYPADMLINLNPPTLPLLSIGMTQVALFQLLRPVLAAAARRRSVQVVMALIASRAMTLYLWHMVVIILLNGVIWLLGWAPEPGSALWWWTRIPMMLTAVAVTLVVTWKLAALERPRPVLPVRRWGIPLGWTALYLAVVPNLVVTWQGLTTVTVWVGVVLLGVAVLLAGAPWAAAGRAHAGAPRVG